VPPASLAGPRVRRSCSRPGRPRCERAGGNPEYSIRTLLSTDQPSGTELLLEPDGHPAAKPFKKALVEDGIPYTSFAVDDVQAEYDRLVTER
jgi:hypothetical protein